MSPASCGWRFELLSFQRVASRGVRFSLLAGSFLGAVIIALLANRETLRVRWCVWRLRTCDPARLERLAYDIAATGSPGLSALDEIAFDPARTDPDSLMLRQVVLRERWDREPLPADGNELWEGRLKIFDHTHHAVPRRAPTNERLERYLRDAWGLDRPGPLELISDVSFGNGRSDPLPKSEGIFQAAAETMLGDPNAWGACAACAYLASYFDDHRLSELLRRGLISSPHPGVRDRCVRWLIYRDLHEQDVPLLRQALEDSSEDVRFEAACALALSFADATGLTELVADVARGGRVQEWDRDRAARALAALGDPRTVEALISVHERLQSEETRTIIEKALGKIEGENPETDWPSWLEGHRTSLPAQVRADPR